MTILCRLTNVSQNGHTRTHIVEGDCSSEPVVGRRFIMFAPPLNPDYDARMVETTEVQSLEPSQEGVLFKTLNTTYRWERLNPTNG